MIMFSICYLKGDVFMREKKLSLFNLVLFLILVLINYIVASGKIPQLLSQKEVSSIYETTITPAGFAFSIWGVIYLLLFISLIYMIKLSKTNKSKLITDISPYLWSMFFFNIMWNFVFSAKFIGISVIMIIGYLFSLIMINVKINKFRSTVNFIFPLAFGIHTGWIIIATIVNFYSFLEKINWNNLGISKDFWTIFALVLAVIIVIFVQYFIGNATIPLSIAWAYFGIYNKPNSSYNDFAFIPVVIIFFIILLFAISIMTFIKNKNSIIPLKNR